MADWNTSTEDNWGSGAVDNAVWGAADAGQDTWGNNATEWNIGGSDRNAAFPDDGAAVDVDVADGEQKCFGCGEAG